MPRFAAALGTRRRRMRPKMPAKSSKTRTFATAKITLKARPGPADNDHNGRAAVRHAGGY